MVKSVALGIALVALTGGFAVAQTVRLTPPARDIGIVLAKHDKGDGEQHGRKLGHYQQRQADDEDADNSDGRSMSRRRSTAPAWTNPAPDYRTPWGYGTTYPYLYRDGNYPPPPYYGGY